MVRALASHQCGPGSSPGIDAICGSSLLLVLSFALRGFSPGTPVFPSPQKPTFSNSNLTRNQVDEEPPGGSSTSKLLFVVFVEAIIHHLSFQNSFWQIANTHIFYIYNLKTKNVIWMLMFSMLNLETNSFMCVLFRN